MLRPIDAWFSRQPEPEKSCLQFMRAHLLQSQPILTEAWKYGMPFYCINGKMCCYLWVHKKYKQPYIGFVEGSRLHHPALLTEKRARMKILLLDANNDLPMEMIDGLVKEMVGLYKPEAL